MKKIVSDNHILALSSNRGIEITDEEYNVIKTLMDNPPSVTLNQTARILDDEKIWEIIETPTNEKYIPYEQIIDILTSGGDE